MVIVLPCIYLFMSVILHQLFGLIGVLLFRTSVPSAFADLPTALFTLFICVTQDGWNEIQKTFEK